MEKGKADTVINDALSETFGAFEIKAKNSFADDITGYDIKGQTTDGARIGFQNEFDILEMKNNPPPPMGQSAYPIQSPKSLAAPVPSIAIGEWRAPNSRISRV